MGAFKLQPKVESRVEFKTGTGKVLLTIAKLDDGNMIVVPKFSCKLNEKEQGRLLDFLLENM